MFAELLSLRNFLGKVREMLYTCMETITNENLGLAPLHRCVGDFVVEILEDVAGDFPGGFSGQNPFCQRPALNLGIFSSLSLL